MTIFEQVKVSGEMPSKIDWKEGADYTVIAGTPQDGDLVRAREVGDDGSVLGEQFYIQQPAPPPPAKPLFKTLSGSEFIALLADTIGFARVDQLLAKSKTVEALLMKADRVDRLKGNTPAAIAYLKTGNDALTDNENTAIDTAWKAL